MIRTEKCIVMDIDGTICPIKRADQDYAELQPHADIVAKMRDYRAQGFYLILHSSRNMKTFDGNIGLITANTGKALLAWLDRHDVPYDELHVGKPWAGRGGFYVDDRTIRPDEFLAMSYDEVLHVVDGAGRTPQTGPA